ncbi:MAG: ATP synthase F1 subunit gamma [Patescibacteria group bacterium]
MPGQGREIRRRIKSIKSTRQVTRAMEMVSAAKMRKAVANVLSTRPYATLAWEVVQAIVEKTNTRYHALLEERGTIKKIGLILITSNRGLTGSFNTNIIEMARQYILHHKEKVNVEADLVIMGRKGREVMQKRGHTMIAEFTKLDVNERVEEIRPLARLVIDEYLKGTYDRIVIAYTDFVSSLVQKPRIKQLLPLISDDPYLGSVGRRIQTPDRIKTHSLRNQTQDDETSERMNASLMRMDAVEEDGYLFEPSPQAVLVGLLPRIVEMQLYQAILESNASEHSSRMFAMRNATDAAGEMIDELTLLYNHDRQAGITREIAEISAGRIAIER